MWNIIHRVMSICLSINLFIYLAILYLYSSLWYLLHINLVLIFLIKACAVNLPVSDSQLHPASGAGIITHPSSS